MSKNNLRQGLVIDHRFTLERRLGSGATGVVWVARDGERGQEVALKILHPQLSHEAMLVAQLAREANVLTQLQHPHIARAIAFQPEGELIYLAMELVEGRPLHEVIGERAKASRHFDREELEALVGQLAGAVGHAHGKWIVHRDLKPQNVVVRELGERLEVKVLDFGIARLLEGSIFDATTFGRQLGSLFYMSPEQVRGEPAGVRSDVFALASIIFELVTLHRAWAWDGAGRPLPAFTGPVPHGEDNAVATVMMRISAGPRPRPSMVRPELSQGFDALLERALAIDAEDRPASVSELAAEVLQELRGAALSHPALPYGFAHPSRLMSGERSSPTVDDQATQMMGAVVEPSPAETALLEGFGAALATSDPRSAPAASKRGVPGTMPFERAFSEELEEAGPTVRASAPMLRARMAPSETLAPAPEDASAPSLRTASPPAERRAARSKRQEARVAPTETHAVAREPSRLGIMLIVGILLSSALLAALVVALFFPPGPQAAPLVEIPSKPDLEAPLE